MERDGLPLFAIRLREHRTGRDYSLAEVAHRLRAHSRETGDGIEAGVTPQRAWRWEQGERPRGRYRRLLCAFYEATPAELGFERLPARVDSDLGRDGHRLASYAVTSYAASSYLSLGMPGCARRHAVAALQLHSNGGRSPSRQAIARLSLAQALAELGAPDEACALGHQALDSTRVVKSVRARARELDVALRHRYPRQAEVAEFHERRSRG